jgi:hypothetical protein
MVSGRLGGWQPDSETTGFRNRSKMVGDVDGTGTEAE